MKGDGVPTIALGFATAEGLAEEVRDNLTQSGCYVQQAKGLELDADVTLRLVHPVDGSTLELPAFVAWVGEDGGAGIQLQPLDDRLAQALDVFPSRGESMGGGDAEAIREGDGQVGAVADDRTAPERLTVQQRMRALKPAEALKVARMGRLDERVALERIYGKHVWGALLSNPSLTVSEVARLARLQTLPRPLLEQIGSNRGWLQNPQVRRALLCNPRSAKDMIMKVLRVMPKPELKVVPMQTAYPLAVRQAAKKMLPR